MLYNPSPVSDSPVCNLYDWRVIKILGEGTHHFSGMTDDPGAGPGRVSSRIVAYHRSGREGTTASGRVYKLRGLPRPTGPGRDTDVDLILDQWLRGALYHDVTDLYV